ncbi:hypothetical protein AB0O31_16165 [Kitasatospora cineracea]|uniref:hypothetical protein n=1 Tax=Kitasatospora cineracea TaxID=88074 RepID=UPI003422C97C
MLGPNGSQFWDESDATADVGDGFKQGGGFDIALKLCRSAISWGAVSYVAVSEFLEMGEKVIVCFDHCPV